MRARAVTTALTGVVLAATTGLTAPPAHAQVCRTAPAQCQAIVDELREQGVCESIPSTTDPRPYSEETAFCDNPDGWSQNITRGIGYAVCGEDGRCDEIIRNTVPPILACLSDIIRCRLSQ